MCERRDMDANAQAPLSAIAALRAKWNQSQAPLQTPAPDTSNKRIRHESRNDQDNPPLLEKRQQNVPKQQAHTYESDESDAYFSTSSHSSERDSETYSENSEEEAEVENLPRQIKTLCTFRANAENVKQHGPNAVLITLRPGETLAIVGQYNIWVVHGLITIMGAVIQKSSQLHCVYAPSSHSLPLIEFPATGHDFTLTKIMISYHEDFLRDLDIVSPMFGRIWNHYEPSTNPPRPEEAEKSHYAWLYSTTDDSWDRALDTCELPSDWGTQLIKLNKRLLGAAPPVVVVCGSKGAGKSTFCKYLLNRFLTAPNTRCAGVAYMDLDPGQPEFLPPGNVYTAYIREPVFGPAFTHPIVFPSRQNAIVQCHHLGVLSPKGDPEHYVRCVCEMLRRYQRYLRTEPKCPLIINTCGYIHGRGLQMLMEVICLLQPTDVVYIGEEGRRQDQIEETAMQCNADFAMLATQPSGPSSKTPRELRAMQTMSYFHLGFSESSMPVWNSMPISFMRPWALDYTNKKGLFGIIVLGDVVNPKYIYDLLDGSVVGIVAVDPAGIPDDATELKPTDSTTDPSVALPYLFLGDGVCTPLDPELSTCLGLALVRSIDTDAHLIYLNTPILESAISKVLAAGKLIVLVRGELDTPGWAYQEDYYSAEVDEQEDWDDVVPWLSEAAEEEEPTNDGSTKEWSTDDEMIEYESTGNGSLEDSLGYDSIDELLGYTSLESESTEEESTDKDIMEE